ncbi:MAG: hypothetical protein Q8M16_13310, partial [Pirellulaceae bacterium]|nr:hypothetical protein [Pirellulaceae bacterium]
YEFSLKSRYTATTDSQGVAVLRSMPTNRTEGLIAELEGFEIPLNGTDRQMYYDIKPGAVNEVTIQMQPAGTQVLKDTTFDLDNNEADAADKKGVGANDRDEASETDSKVSDN